LDTLQKNLATKEVTTLVGTGKIENSGDGAQLKTPTSITRKALPITERETSTFPQKKVTSAKSINPAAAKTTQEARTGLTSIL
jgi:hypothetical protein